MPRIHDMPSSLAALPLLFAENAPAAAPAAGSANSIQQILPLVLVLGFWGYFLLFRPQQIQEKKRREMISSLKKNDRIMTTGGIYGTVISVDEDQDRVVVRVDDDKGVKLTFSRTAVGRVIEPNPDKPAN